MNQLWIDTETYCDLDLKKVGLYKYVSHESFKIWCLAYAIDDNPVCIWKGNGPTPEQLKIAFEDKTVKIYAHNAEFEWQVLKTIGRSIPLTRWVDTQALSAVFGFPLGLEKFCGAVGLTKGKDAKGTRLINKLCKIQKKTIKNPVGRWYPVTAPEEFENLYSYCKQDVNVMRSAVKRLPQDELSKFEQYVWGRTLMQNARGVKIDLRAVSNIQKKLLEFKIHQEFTLSNTTGGHVKTGNQVAKMKEFLHGCGVYVPNLTKDTVNLWLEKKIPVIARKILELRKQLAHSSVAKFDKMLLMQTQSIVRGNLVYYGAHTGRFAGRGLQVHNLPRAGVDNPEETISHFNKLGIKELIERYPDMNAVASKLIRSMIIPNEGTHLLVADYSSVENVVLHWAAGDEKTTQDFREGLCQYKVYSAARLGISYDQVTKEQRTQSKPDVLGLGYGGGPRALISVAAGYGVTLTQNEAQERVNFYRKKYKLIPSLWRKVANKVKEAVRTKDPQVLITPNIKLEFRCAGGYLFILLPSGRRLAYPKIELDALWYINVKEKQVPMSSEISYMGVKSGMWVRIGTHPGMLVENIVQAMARDLLVYGLLCAEQAGYKILMSVHDEAIAEGTQSNIKDFCEYLCMRQSWAKTLPLKAEGYIAKRYKKG